MSITYTPWPPRMKTLRRVAPLLIILAACQEAEQQPDWDQACMAGILEPVAIDPAGTLTTWVVDSVQMTTFGHPVGVNIDCDAQLRPDNAMGSAVSGIYLHETTSDLNEEVAALIDAGRLLHLFSLRSTALVDASGVGVTLLHGLDTDGDPTDNFDGAEPFDIDTGRGRGTVSGSINGDQLSVRGGQLPIGMILPSLDEVVILPIEGARI